jgi:hypothetical protein
MVRTAGSFLTDDFKIGTAVDVSGATNPENNGRFVISNVTALELTVQVNVANTVTMPFVNEAAGATVTIATAGKLLIIPLNGRTNDSFTIEKYYETINTSEVYTGIKISMDPASRGPYSGGTVDLRNPMAQQDSDQFARRLYSAPLDASWADMLPYDYPIETVTPKLMGALTQLAAQHGDLDLLRPRMTGQEFINTLRGKPIDKMRALKEAGVPATFFLRGGQRGKLPDVLSPEDFNFVIHDQTRLGKPGYDEFATQRAS